ncbi:MAG: nitroreductase family protein [Dehalococcoidia bacterium]|nr:MAG: nitroreductase family protein [Dehalococcoidia bacterium]
MDVYEAVITRRSIREFKKTPVAYEILERCVNAGRLAPTAVNCQLCEYIVIDDDELLPQVLDTITSLSGVPRPEDGWPPDRQPRAYIVALINTELEFQIGAGRTNTLYDVGLAMENIVLVALEEGLGSCVMTGVDRGRLGRLLNIADKYEIAMLLSLGYADENPVIEIASDSVERWVDKNGVRHIPKRKLEDIIHRNKFAS